MSAALRQPFAVTTGTLSDEDLVAAIRSGNLTGLGTLFDRHGNAVRRLVARLGAHARDVDDLVQETFLDCIVAAAKFERGSAVRPWLLGVAMMVMRRHRRSLGRMFRRLEQWASQHVERPVPTPADELEWSESARRGQRALSLLPAKKRDAFVLVVVEELSGDEAAAVLGVPIATLWTRVHYARREMLRLLELDPP